MARVMLKVKKVPIQLWAKALNTTCYIQNRVYLLPGTSTTPYEIWRGKKPNLKHLHEFGSTFFVLNDREHMSKFDSTSDKGVFLRYSPNNRAYRVYKKRSKTVMESADVVVNDLGIVSIALRLEESEIEGPLHASREDASANDAASRDSSSLDTEDASPFAESLSLPEDPTTSSTGFNRETSRQVQK